MSTPLVDRNQLIKNRSRAIARDGDFFLHEEAMHEIKDRLDMVNKSFKNVAVVSGFPDIWRRWFGDAVHVIDDDLLALEPQKYDLVIHAMSLHWANDPVGQLIQCNRALVPDGLFIAAFFGDQTIHELRASLSQAEAQLSGGLSARVLPMGELRDLGALLQRAGLALPVADKSTRNVTYKDLATLIRDLRDMGENNALSARPTHAANPALFDLTENLYRKHYSTQGLLEARFDIVFLTGWAPDASQPKPLMPGSAKTRLSEALKTNEIKLPES